MNRTSSACKRNSSGHFSPKSPDCLPGGHIKIEFEECGQSAGLRNATNAHDQVTSERGGPSPYRAVEPWLLLLYSVICYKCFSEKTTVKKADERKKEKDLNFLEDKA
jgi:hypothetical protein